MEMTTRWMHKVTAGLRLVREYLTGYFSTFHNRPLYAKDVGIASKEEINSSIAIVIQGPLVTKHSFTLETVRLYKKIFAGAPIIVSTWEGEDARTITDIREEGVDIILNKTPAYSGPAHINYQIVSASTGIKKAREQGASYVLKTRSDQRMYTSRAFAYFRAMMSAFPLANESKQRERIIAVSMNTFKYRPYSISDMTMFGTMDDMERYWCPPLSDAKSMPSKEYSMGEWSQARHAEVYLCCHFLESLGRQLAFTLADSWAAYRDHFCIIDKESIDLFWYKYDKEKEYRRVRYDALHNDQELSFQEWLTLYTSFPADIPEYIIDQKLGKAL